MSADELSKVLLDYYKHQRRLGAAISGDTLLIDCHSFPRELAPDIDICIGYNEGEANAPSESILKMTEQFFRIRGYKVARNKPYSNSITPLAPGPYQSMKIEVNKDLYLKSDGTIGSGFWVLQGQINDFYSFLLNDSRKKEKAPPLNPAIDKYIIKHKDLIPVIRAGMSKRYARSFDNEWAEGLLRACALYKFYEVRKGRWDELGMTRTIYNFERKYMPSHLYLETRDTLMPEVLEKIEAAGIQSYFAHECRLFSVWYKKKWNL